jgi:purine-binding chemotaxis protein CheW
MNTPTHTYQQYSILTFQVANQEYGLPVSHVIQIIEMVAITALPEMPPAVQGVINQRGRIVPVLDMRLRLGLSFRPYRLRTPMIVVEANNRPLALVVDQVAAVLTLEPADLELADSLYLVGNEGLGGAGLAKVDGRLVPILSVTTLLHFDDHSRLLVATYPEKEEIGS